MSKNRTYKIFDINDLLLRGHILHNSKTGKKNIFWRKHIHTKIFQQQKKTLNLVCSRYEKKKMWDVSYD